MASTAQIAPVMTDVDFDRIRRMAHETCGIDLQTNKRTLVSSRLDRLVRRRRFGTFREYVNFVAQRKRGPEFAEFIDALTTNHTSFLREPGHFDFLRREILPGRSTGIRIWSAACSTGEEPYTIGMCALESHANSAANCRIVATDISQTVIDAASAGVYVAAKLVDLPPEWTSGYFRMAGEPGKKIVCGPLRALVDFRRLNLQEPFTHLGVFDTIFCRNVMIYFDQATRERLVARLVDRLAVGGYLFTGHAETLLSLPSGLSYVRPAVYRKGGKF